MEGGTGLAETLADSLALTDADSDALPLTDDVCERDAGLGDTDQLALMDDVGDQDAGDGVTDGVGDCDPGDAVGVSDTVEVTDRDDEADHGLRVADKLSEDVREALAGLFVAETLMDDVTDRDDVADAGLFVADTLHDDVADG